MDELPTSSLDMPSFSFGDIMLSQGFLQAIFYLSTLLTIIFTIVLFTHWKKYAPEPLKIFLYTIVYLTGIGALIFGQIILLSIY